MGDSGHIEPRSPKAERGVRIPGVTGDGFGINPDLGVWL